MPKHKEELLDEDSGSGKKTRQRFGQHEDYLLVVQVQADTPYHARHGAIGDTWDNVAARLNAHPDFHMRPIKGTTAKTRFDTLVHRHRKWLASEDNVEHLDEKATPFRQLLTDLVTTLAVRRPKRTDNRPDKTEDDHDNDTIPAKAARTRIRLGKRRHSESLDTFECDRPGRRDKLVCPGAIGTDQMQVTSDDAGPAAPVTVDATESSEAPTLPQSPIGEDVVTVQQAMAELLKMQHAFATRPYQMNVSELEKINEARLREEEEKTKQRGLELQIEMQRTRRRQLELDFEKEERKKDREEQAKLIASLVERLEPKGH